jgi:hypothetical protein
VVLITPAARVVPPPQRATLECRRTRMSYLAVITALLLASAAPTTSAIPATSATAATPRAPAGADAAAVPQALLPTDPVDVIKTHIDAYNRRDLDALTATFSSDARIFILPSTEPVYAGQAAIRTAYGDQLEGNCMGTMRRECPDLNSKVTSWQVIGEYVVTYQLVTLLDTAPPIPYVLIYEVHDGLIRNAWFLVER